jgi:hypothetical protein
MQEEIERKQRLAWGFSEISEVTGLSVNFLRNEEKRGKLKVRPFGRRKLVLTEDLKAYLAGDGVLPEGASAQAAA